MFNKLLIGAFVAVSFGLFFSCNENDKSDDGIAVSYFDISPLVSVVNKENIDLLNPNNEGAYNVEEDISLENGDLVLRAKNSRPNSIFLDDTKENRRGFEVDSTGDYYKIKINSFIFSHKNPFYTEVINIKSKNGKVYSYNLKAEGIYFLSKGKMLGGSSLYLKKLWLNDKLVWEIKLDEKGDIVSEKYNPSVTIVIPDNN